MYISNEIINIIDIIACNIREKKLRLLKDPSSPLVIKGQTFTYSVRLRKHEYMNYTTLQKSLIHVLEKDGIIVDSIVLNNYKRWIDKLTCSKSHNSYTITVKYNIMNRELLDTRIRKNLTSDSL